MMKLIPKDSMPVTGVRACEMVCAFIVGVLFWSERKSEAWTAQNLGEVSGPK